MTAADPAAVRTAAIRLRNARRAQEDGGTWAQVAPLLGCTDAASAKREAHRLERMLKPLAHQMAAAQQMADAAADAPNP